MMNKRIIVTIAYYAASAAMLFSLIGLAHQLLGLWLTVPPTINEGPCEEPGCLYFCFKASCECYMCPSDFKRDAKTYGIGEMDKYWVEDSIKVDESMVEVMRNWLHQKTMGANSL